MVFPARDRGSAEPVRDECIELDRAIGRSAADPAWATLPCRSWAPPLRRTVVVAPHPDDEVLGCGGLIARQRAHGLDVLVVAVTDGDAAFGAPDAKLAHRRRGEQTEACARLGLVPDAIIRLGLPDGEVAQHEAAVTAALRALLQPGDLVAAPWPGDHHCDHEAVGRAVTRASTDRRGPAVELVGSLVWGPLRSAPPSTAELPLLALRLTAEEQRRRLEALACHRSQHGETGRPAVVSAELARAALDRTERYVPCRMGSRR